MLQFCHKNHQNGNSSLVKNDGIYEYKYDNNGNRISKEGNGEAWKYEWDLHNRLIKVEMESNGNKMVEVSYRYDLKIISSGVKAMEILYPLCANIVVA